MFTLFRMCNKKNILITVQALKKYEKNFRQDNASETRSSYFTKMLHALTFALIRLK